MSKTYTSRPSLAQNSSRRNTSQQTQRSTHNQSQKIPPAGRGVTPSKKMDNTSVPRSRPGMENRETSPQRQQQTDIGQRMSYQGSFTMITPNERKRQEISNQAKKEEENYSAYKEKNRLTYVSYVGTAGGGETTQTDARQKLAQNRRTSQVNTHQKQQQWRDEKKRREETVFQRHKDVQRQKTVKNEQVAIQKERDKQKKWDEDRRRKNEALFQKLEKRSSPAVKTDSANSQAGSVQHSVPRSVPDTHPVDHDVGATAAATTSLSAAEQDIQTLQAMFPHCDREILKDILQQTNNSIDQAIELLQT